MNHVIDPTFFYDAIAEFAFDYDIYVRKSETVNNRGIQVQTYEKHTINGSLQVNDRQRSFRKSGSTDLIDYNFYCKSLYRINIGDFIHYHNEWLYCDSVHDYDEWGVREAHLTAVQLTAYQDLADYVKFLNGELIV